MQRLIRRFTIRVTTGLVLTGVWLNPALAQSTLSRAEVYRVSNQVEIDRQNQGSWSPAAAGDAMVPLDALRTAAQSRAELLFNEGTLVRTGEGTVFRFPPGRRSFEIVDGSALFMIRPGQGDSQVMTPQAVITAKGTALFVQHDPQQNTSIVGVLTDSPAGPVTVRNLAGDVVMELRAGQFVSVANGVIGLVEQFLLPVFYQSVDLAVGLGTGQENFVAQQSPDVQQTINAVRAEAIDPLRNQTVWLQSLCGTSVSTLQDVLQNSDLLRILLPGTVPPAQVSLQIPASDLVVTPVRSVAGLLWLGNFCQAR